MSTFNEKVAIVTGAATGIGYGISKRLSSENTKIIMVDFDGNMAEQSSSELIAKGGEMGPRRYPCKQRRNWRNKWQHLGTRSGRTRQSLQNQP